MKYEVIYIKKESKILEAENSYDIDNIAKQHCPEGYEVEDWFEAIEEDKDSKSVGVHH